VITVYSEKSGGALMEMVPPFAKMVIPTLE